MAYQIAMRLINEYFVSLFFTVIGVDCELSWNRTYGNQQCLIHLLLLEYLCGRTFQRD